MPDVEQLYEQNISDWNTKMTYQMDKDLHDVYLNLFDLLFEALDIQTSKVYSSLMWLSTMKCYQHYVFEDFDDRNEILAVSIRLLVLMVVVDYVIAIQQCWCHDVVD